MGQEVKGRLPLGPDFWAITYHHVVDERRPSPGVIIDKNKMITLLAGGAIDPPGNRRLTINAKNSTLDNVSADIPARNGIIHVIDFLLFPSTSSNQHVSTSSLLHAGLFVPYRLDQVPLFQTLSNNLTRAI